MPVLSNWEDSLYYAVVSCFAPAFQVYPLPDHIIDNQPDFLKTRPPKSTMSALFTSAGTSRARTAVKDRRRVLARASMMASNRLCPLATELTGHLVLVLVEQRLPIRKPLCNWTGGRGGAAATREGRCGHTCTAETKLVLLWSWCTVHSARAHFTATAAGKTGSSLCETSNQPLGLPRPSSGISIASPSSKDQRAAFSKRPKKPTRTQTEVNCGRK